MTALIAPDVSPAALRDCRRKVQNRLAAVRRRLRLQLLLEGVAWGIGAAILLIAFSLLIDWLLRPDLPIRLSLLIIGAIALVVIVFQRLRDPFCLRFDDLDLAELLERRHKGLGQRLTTVLQLPHLLEQDPSASRSMIHAAVQENFAELEKIDLQASFDSKRRNQVVFLLGSLMTLVFIFCFTQPAVANLWARRWFAGATIRWPQHSYLVIAGLGDAAQWQVPSDESSMIQVDSARDFVHVENGWRLSGRGEPLIIEGLRCPMSVPPESVSIKMILADGSLRIGNFSKFAAGQYRYELPPISKPATITITGGDDWLGPIQVVPVLRPAIDRLTIKAFTPGKSEPDLLRADDAEQQLLFLSTTRLEIELVGTQPLSSAKVAVSGSDATASELIRLDARTYRMEWEIKEAVTFEFQLEGESGGLTSKPYFLTLGILNDRPPRLTLRSSGVGKRVTPVAQIPLNLRVMDDFGVANLALALEDIRIVEQKAVTSSHQPLEEQFLSSGQKLPLDVEREPILALSQYNLVPGVSIRLRGTASDACVLGKQAGESRWLSFQIVSPEELFYEILTRQREQRDKLNKSLETAKSQLDALRVIAVPAESAPLIRVHQALTRQIWQIAGQLNGTLQEMTLNDLGAPATRQLLEVAIIKPMYDLHANALTDLRGKLDVLNSGNTVDEERRATATAAQTVAVEQIQRILDKMSDWESFVDVVNQLRTIRESQTKIHETTDKTQKEQIKEIFDNE